MAKDLTAGPCSVDNCTSRMLRPVVRQQQDGVTFHGPLPQYLRCRPRVGSLKRDLYRVQLHGPDSGPGAAFRDQTVADPSKFIAVVSAWHPFPPAPIVDRDVRCGPLSSGTVTRPRRRASPCSPARKRTLPRDPPGHRVRAARRRILKPRLPGAESWPAHVLLSTHGGSPGLLPQPWKPCSLRHGGCAASCIWRTPVAPCAATAVGA